MTYGPDAVHGLIEDAGWSYPVSVERLERTHPLANVEISQEGYSIMLVELLSEMDVEKFESERDLRQKLQPVFERKRAERKPGVFDRVKDVFRS
jgi:hypothetical protein